MNQTPEPCDICDRPITEASRTPYLCAECSDGLDAFRNNAATVRAAIQYLEGR